MNTDLIDGIGIVADGFPQWVPIAIAFLIFIALMNCIYRARSIDFLLDRIWIFFGGNKDFHDKSLNDEWNVIRDLELYRYRYRFPFNSISEIEYMRKWIKENDISLIELRRINGAFDFNKFKVKSKKFSFEKNLLLFVSAFFIFFTFMGAQMIIEDSAYFVVVETDEKFLFNGAKIVFKNKELNRKQCNKIRNGPYPDSDEDKNLFNEYLACEMFGVDGKKLYEKTIKELRILGFTSVSIFTFLFIFLIRFYIGYNLAIKIGEKIEYKNANKTSESERFLEIE